MEAQHGADRPAMSVVVASWAGETALFRCLGSLEPQWGPTEIIVAFNGEPEPVAGLAARSPKLRLVRGPEGASVFRLRTLGIEQARGRVIALTEDHATVSPRWVEALCTAHRAGRAIVGGPVENGLVERAYDWALYLCEYGLHMPPVSEGPVDQLSGINVSYDHDLLISCRNIWRDAFRENEVHDALRTAGHQPYLIPDAWVKSHLPMRLGEAMMHLFGGGCHFGRYRTSRSTSLGRLFLALASPAVPLILLGRLAHRVAVRQPARIWHLVRGLGYLALVLGAWSAGEALGYVSRGTSAAVAEG